MTISHLAYQTLVVNHVHHNKTPMLYMVLSFASKILVNDLDNTFEYIVHHLSCGGIFLEKHEDRGGNKRNVLQGAVLLCGYESWVIIDSMWKALEGFHHGVACCVSGKTARRIARTSSPVQLQLESLITAKPLLVLLSWNPYFLPLRLAPPLLPQ